MAPLTKSGSATTAVSRPAFEQRMPKDAPKHPFGHALADARHAAQLLPSRRSACPSPDPGRPTAEAHDDASASDAAPPACQRDPEAEPESDDATLDPLLRRPELLSTSTSIHAPLPPGGPPPLVPEAARASLAELLPALVRRVAWSGDGRKGAIRLELGAGALAGATLVVEADDGRVRVHLRAPPGVDLTAWRNRIGARLAARLLVVDSVSVE